MSVDFISDRIANEEEAGLILEKIVLCKITLEIALRNAPKGAFVVWVRNASQVEETYALEICIKLDDFKHEVLMSNVHTGIPLGQMNLELRQALINQ